jgi:hypothetical protein
VLQSPNTPNPSKKKKKKKRERGSQFEDKTIHRGSALKSVCAAADVDLKIICYSSSSK